MKLNDNNHGKPIKIGLLVSSTEVSNYIYEIVQWASGQDDILISHLILPKKIYISDNKIIRVFKFIKHKGIKIFFREIF